MIELAYLSNPPLSLYPVRHQQPLKEMHPVRVQQPTKSKLYLVCINLALELVWYAKHVTKFCEHLFSLPTCLLCTLLTNIKPDHYS